jgi:ADP-ribose pyrophosphatase YjhB (NUDIX family)
MDMARKAVAAIVNYNGSILIGKKKESDGKYLSGKWHIPGETLQKGETDISALTRGINEEAGIEIQVVKYLASHKTPKHTMVNWYECIPKTTDISAGSDLSEVKWVPKKDVINICADEAKSFWPKEVRNYFS